MININKPFRSTNNFVLRRSIYCIMQHSSHKWIWLLITLPTFSRKFLSFHIKRKKKREWGAFLILQTSSRTLPTWILPLHRPTSSWLWTPSLHFRPSSPNPISFHFYIIILLMKCQRVLCHVALPFLTHWAYSPPTPRPPSFWYGLHYCTYLFTDMQGTEGHGYRVRAR